MAASTHFFRMASTGSVYKEAAGMPCSSGTRSTRVFRYEGLEGIFLPGVRFVRRTSPDRTEDAFTVRCDSLIERRTWLANDRLGEPSILIEPEVTGECACGAFRFGLNGSETAARFHWVGQFSNAERALRIASLGRPMPNHAEQPMRICMCLNRGDISDAYF